jgi:hypothetical protein
MKMKSSSNGCELVCLAPPRENWALLGRISVTRLNNVKSFPESVFLGYTSVEESKKLVVLVEVKANTVVLHLQIFAIIRRTHHFTVEE